MTVIVHTVNVEGGANQGADMNFIKLFTQVCAHCYTLSLSMYVESSSNELLRLRRCCRITTRRD